MSYSVGNRGWALLAALVIFFCLCFRLGHLPLLPPDEGRNAEIGREMQESGAWLVPTYNGLDRLDKPAFHYKTVGLSMAFFGENETAARLPSALAALGVVLLVFSFARRVSDTRTALFAAIIAATTPLLIANARTVILDMELAFFVCAAIFAGYLAEVPGEPARRKWYLAGAAMAGVATLIKGPVGFLVPALVLLVFGRVEGRPGVWKRLLGPWNLLVFFGLTLPWFVALCWRHPDFFQYGLLEETFKRFTSAKTFRRSEPFYFYFLIVALTFFPWSLLLPGAALAAWKRRASLTSVDRLCIVWASVTVLFFTLSSSKLPGYILSVVVPSALLSARLFTAALAAHESRAARLVRQSAGVFGGLCLVLGAVCLLGSSQAGLLAQPLRILPGDAGRLRDAALIFSVLLTGVAGLALAAWWRRNSQLALLSMALLSPLVVVLGVKAFEVIYEAKSFRNLARELGNLPADSELAFLKVFPQGLDFYLERECVLITQDGRELTSNYIKAYLEHHPWPADRVIPLAELESWLHSRTKPVFILAPSSELPRLEVLAREHRGKIQMCSNRLIGLSVNPAS